MYPIRFIHAILLHSRQIPFAITAQSESDTLVRVGDRYAAFALIRHRG